MRRLLPFFAAILSFAACEDPMQGDDNDGPQVDLTPIEIKLDVNSVVFSDEEGSKTVSFTSTADWTAEVINSRADTWCTVKPQRGVAGDAAITINTTVNETPDDRYASIVIKAGAISKTITVSQKQRNALTATTSKFEVGPDGGEVSVEVKSNIEFEYEIEEAGKEWVKYVGTRAMKTYTLVFRVEENDDVKKREARIKIRSGQLEENITIYQAGAVPSIVLSQDEYVVSSEFETISVDVSSNVDVKVEIPADIDWITNNVTRATSTNTYRFDISANEEYDPRSAELKFTNKENNLSEVVKVVQAQKDAIVLAKSEYEFSADGGNLDFEVQTNIDISVTVSDNAADWIHQVETRGLEAKSLYFNVMPCSSLESREGVITLSGDNVMQTVTIRQSGMKDILEKERKALIAFYNATGGDNWLHNDNWCSDKPVGQWYGILTDETGFVIHMVLFDNNLTGSIPESIADLKRLGNLNLDMNKLGGELPESICDLTELMQLTAVNNNFTGTIPESIGNLVNLQYLYLNSNQLSGELPASIGNLTNLTHLMLGYNNLTGSLPESINEMVSLTDVFIPSNYFTGNVPERFMELDKWQTNWHEILDQLGEGFSKEGLVIPAPKFREPTLDGKYLDYSIYAENEYTILYHYYDWCNWSYSFTPELVELYKGYKNKGLEVIAFSVEGTIESHKKFSESLHTEWPYIMLSENKDIFNAHVWISPGVSVVDKTGHIVFNNYTDDYNDLRAFLLENLGTPDQTGPSEGPTFYESTDYSKDGEVKQLQRATKGKGIDVVLMGDAYTDRLIADGTYDAAMQSVMAKLFTEEPYESFRDYFNVYSVTAVSKNETYSSFTETAIRGYFGLNQSEVGGDDSMAFTYALKAIDDERLDQALVIVIMNSEVYAGTCYMYVPSVEGDWSNGVSVSYFPVGSDEVLLERLIHHEACGHGFAKLADEYSEGHIGAFPEEDISLMQSEQKDLGWWKNVDFTSDLSQIRWSYFINDPRYADEGLGAFEGGLTYLTGVWRPTSDSIMRYNWGGFNAPSREAIYYRIHKLAYGADWEYSYEDFVEWDARNRKPATRGVQIPYRPEVQDDFGPTHSPVVVPHTWRDEMNR